MLVEEQQWYYLTHSWEGIKGAHTFLKSISLKMNITQLEFKPLFWGHISTCCYATKIHTNLILIICFNSSNICVPSMTLNYIWWWDSSSEVQGSIRYSLIALTSRSTDSECYWNHFEMRLLNLRINLFFFYLLWTFCPQLGSFCVSSSLRFNQISPLALFKW